MKLSSLLVTLTLFTGCGLLTPKGASSKSEPKPEATATDESASPESDEVEEAEEKPALTQAEIEEQMAPPEGLLDLRTFVGTDPDDPLPAIFKGAKKGMSKKELGKLFPGVEKYNVDMLTLTSKNGGKSWYRVKGEQPHIDILNVEYDDDGGLEQLDYLIDEKKSSPELWAYMKKAAGLKWGKPDLGELDDESELAEWKPDGLKKIQIHKGDMVSVMVEF